MVFCMEENQQIVCPHHVYRHPITECCTSTTSGGGRNPSMGFADAWRGHLGIKRVFAWRNRVARIANWKHTNLALFDRWDCFFKSRSCFGPPVMKLWFGRNQMYHAIWWQVWRCPPKLTRFPWASFIAISCTVLIRSIEVTGCVAFTMIWNECSMASNTTVQSNFNDRRLNCIAASFYHLVHWFFKGWLGSVRVNRTVFYNCNARTRSRLVSLKFRKILCMCSRRGIVVYIEHRGDRMIPRVYMKQQDDYRSEMCTWLNYDNRRNKWSPRRYVPCNLL